MSNINSMQDKILSLLYKTVPGRMLIRPLISPVVSDLGGVLLSSRLSSLIVKPFIEANNIDISDCEDKEYTSFNDFFTRKLSDPEANIIYDENKIIAPCDGRLTVYPITEDGVFTVKHTTYTLKELLKSKKLAKRYEGGKIWMYRLCVDDYHRYIYPVSGHKSKNKRINGVFHTVNPIANDLYPIYKENTREFCLIKTANAGTFLQMEVGAMLVGKIENADVYDREVTRGEEKGNFAFGGSTIIILTENGRAVEDEFIGVQSAMLNETRVKMGQVVGQVIDR